MLKELRPALVLLGAFTLITGALYPAAVTGIAKLAFPKQAEGSVILRSGKPVGSILIGQTFTSPKYFWSRPSATSPMPHNAASGNGSNQGPLNPALTEAVKARIEALKASDPQQHDPIPVDLVTTSGSGLDPHISPAAAAWQAPRVARERGLDRARVDALIAQHTQGRQLGVLGEPRVNVLMLNLALDALKY
ncbi:potassium-transporting ATPase subunit KdpC [Niveibacterium umoris]|uniref:Potassium-transporting ATPase KdpC subunit n=1 Tax=Niveibacterium umoris TaxID=1193620 RepID=A0A840BJC0_9RHOO|nr:potassium-transporting ATPase subunit KdpC [Niveibacterium umoris]MBB4011698.1 K+-transporting ATPase ATPase C chain [Niveibacterium umoris]